MMKVTIVLGMVLCQAFLANGFEMDQALDGLVDTIQTMVNSVKGVRSSMIDLARQTMSQQLFVEERIRSDGSSGLKQVRTVNWGNQNYYHNSHKYKGTASIHNHAEHNDTVGMGEGVYVLNGVEFRTRHNDYTLYEPSTTSREYHATQPIKYPEIPPEVLRKPTVEEQVEEMREYFVAFHTQNTTHRNYKPYFRPIMCYLEGAWTLDKIIQEPFQSPRHNLEASSWEELHQQVYYTSYTGSKNLRENFSYLPTTIMGINQTTGEPIYAQWNYRILCKPYSKDIPLKYFKLMEDWAYMEAYRQPISRVAASRSARFRLSYSDVERMMPHDIIDDIMMEIPGLDNIPEMLSEKTFNDGVLRVINGTLKDFNTGYYHRSYKTRLNGAMGHNNVQRGFADEFLFVAENTQPRVAGQWISHPDNIARFSYALPLEVIWLTPLLTWNPYELGFCSLNEAREGGRGGLLDAAKAFKCASRKIYYLTPAEFFHGYATDELDEADTSRPFVGVLDKNGVPRAVMSSGPRIFTYPIPGIGPVRLRYPVMPLHGEGSEVWKEVNVIKKKLRGMHEKQQKSGIMLKMRATTTTGYHTHDFMITHEEVDALKSGVTISVTTSLASGHVHQLDIEWNIDLQKFRYVLCGGQARCWDGHWPDLEIEENEF